MTFNQEIVLVLAPHTDDGELGCGALIAQLCNAGKKVYYAAFSTCERSLPAGFAPRTLENELRAATSVLGIPAERLTIFDFDVRTFKEHRQPVLEEMIKLRSTIKPDLVFVPASTDIHQDHQAIHDEGVRAFKNSSILGYEMPWNNSVFNIGAFVEIEETHLQRKIEALKEYKSQAHRNYLSEDFIRSLATVRGVQSGKKFAEAFEVIRFIL